MHYAPIETTELYLPEDAEEKLGRIFKPDKETVQARQQVKSQTRVGYNKYVDITVGVNYAFE